MEFKITATRPPVPFVFYPVSQVIISSWDLRHLLYPFLLIRSLNQNLCLNLKYPTSFIKPTSTSSIHSTTGQKLPSLVIIDVE